MEMENSALMQLMMTQTSILEEIRELRRKEVMQGQISAISPGADIASMTNSVPGDIAAPVSDFPMTEFPMQGEAISPMVPMAPFDGAQTYGYMTPSSATSISPQTGSVANPLSYGAISKVPVVGQSIEDAISFDASRMSKEATAEHFAQRSKGVQMGVVEGAGNVVEGVGAVGGFMVGGVLSGLAVGGAVAVGTGYVANEMSQGAQAALNYQDILRRDGYKAFNALESTTEYGGIGMSLDDQQDISKFMRDEAANSLLEDDEMSAILQGGLDNKLLKSVEDVKQFKEKFSGLVKSVKEISVTLDKTIDEAVEFMGEMERRGVGVDRMTSVAANSKVGASFLGISEEQYTDRMLQQTDAIVAGTTADAETVMTNIGFNSFVASAVEKVSKEGDGVVNQYMKNRGGAPAVAAEVEMDMRNFFTGAGQDHLLALYGGAFEQDESGNFSLNQVKLDEMLNSGMTPDELMKASSAATSELGDIDRLKLAGSVGSIFNQSASADQIYSTAQGIQQRYQDVGGLDAQSALTSMGLAENYDEARMMNDFIIGAADGSAQAQFDALTEKEEMDSERLANSPSLKKKAKFWWKQKIENPIGDIGQFFSDNTGDISQDLQMWAAGIEESGLVGGDMVDDVSENTREVLFDGSDSNLEKTWSGIKELNPDAKGPEGLEDKLEKKIKFTSGEFQKMIDDFDAGNLTAADLKDMRNNLENGVYSDSAEDQVNYLLNKAGGEHEGFWNKGKELADYTRATAMLNLEDMGIRSGDSDAGKEIAELGKEIEKEKESASSKLTKLMTGAEDIGVSSDEYVTLEESVRSGDVSAVKGLTSNKELISVAEEFKGIQERSEKLAEASSGYEANYKNTAGVLQLTGGIYDYLDMLNIHSEDEFDEYYGKARKDLGDQLDGSASLLKNGRLDDQGMADTYDFAVEAGKNIITSLGEKEQIGLAERLATQNASLEMSDLYKKGTKEIDPEKLYEQVMERQRVQNTDQNAVEDAIKSSDEAARVSGEHTKAMDSYTDAMLTEIAILNEATTAIKNKTYKTRTGVSTGP